MPRSMPYRGGKGNGGVRYMTLRQKTGGLNNVMLVVGVTMFMVW